MKNNKIKEFFRFTIGKLVIAFMVGILFFLGSIICSPQCFFPGPCVLRCGIVLRIISVLPYRLLVTIPLYLALIYILTCFIVYIWRKTEKNVKRRLKNEERKNQVAEFFKPKVWKVILTIITTIISYFYLGPREIWTINDFIGPTTMYEYAPIGIKNPYLLIPIFLIFFYLLFSLIGILTQKIMKRKEVEK